MVIVILVSLQEVSACDAVRQVLFIVLGVQTGTDAAEVAIACMQILCQLRPHVQTGTDAAEVAIACMP